MSKIFQVLLLLTTFLWTISSAPMDYSQQQYYMFHQNPTCVHANLSPNINSYQNETEGLYGYISSCHYNTKQHQTVIRGRFTNLPGDLNKRNYHFYLLNPDNSLRRDLSQLFQNGLIINENGDSAELLLNLAKSNDFPLEGINSYVDGWVKLYHLGGAFVSSAGPAQFHSIGNLLEKEL